jgi:hypothetical protein
MSALKLAAVMPNTAAQARRLRAYDQGHETGRSAIYLADYRDDLEAAIDEWTWFDLLPLGSNVSAMEFEMSSTDTGPFGMNTPAYFAVDDLTFQVVPEPVGVSGLTGALVLLLIAARRIG